MKLLPVLTLYHKHARPNTVSSMFLACLQCLQSSGNMETAVCFASSLKVAEIVPKRTVSKRNRITLKTF